MDGFRPKRAETRCDRPTDAPENCPHRGRTELLKFSISFRREAQLSRGMYMKFSQRCVHQSQFSSN